MNQNHKKKILIILLIIFGGVLCGATAGVYIALIHDMPEIRSLEDYSPSMITRIYSREKIVIAELYTEKRDPISLSDIPYYLTQSLLIMEDRKFYDHPGIDIKGILRAILTDIRAWKLKEGASTITQQLAKTLFLTPEKTLIRKIREALLALQLERRYTKDEILELYLNQVYYGSGAYGVKSAARIFFDKPLAELTLGECALIAAMPRLPSRYSPLVNPELAVRRRNIVLAQLLKAQLIAPEEYHKFTDEPLSLNQNTGTQTIAGYFVDYIKEYLEAELADVVSSHILYKGGLNIYTTLSVEMQEAAEKIISSRLSELRRRMESAGLPQANPQAALAAIDVHTGGILALVGGEDYKKSQFNRAVKAIRQPGSAFKPIIYACAVEQQIPQSRTILDAPIIYKNLDQGQDWIPKNYSQTYSGEITLRKALSHSINIPAIRLLESLKVATVINFARRLGIESPLGNNLSLALGTSGVSLLEITAAYAVFPRRGQWIKPFGLMEISDKNGTVLWRAKPEQTIAMTREGAAVITNMLEAVMIEGTGTGAKGIRVQIAGKTGTTNDCKDAWFVGFSPSIAAGVWVGRDEFLTLGRLETGSRAALPIWTDFMHIINAGEPYQYFDIPQDVVQLNMDVNSGKKTTPDSPNAVKAMFIKGTEPQ